MYGIFNRVLLITSIITLNSILFKNYWFRPNKYKKQVLGVAGGFVGILFMIYPDYQINFITYLNTLWLTLSTTLLFGNFISCLISGIIPLIFYVLFYFSKTVVFVTILFIASCVLIDKLPLNKVRKWIIVNGIFSIIMLIYATNSSISNGFIIISILLNAYIAFVMSMFKKNYYSYFHLKSQATKDFLTETNNSRQFDIILKNTFKDINKNHGKLSLLILDIDYFKLINDTYGHPVGDKILKQFALILNRLCSANNVFRIGGEEFCILLPKYSLYEAYDMAEKIRKTIQSHNFKIDINSHINITVSIGISTSPDIAKDKESLIKSADEALYKAKNSGRNKVTTPIQLYKIEESAQ